MKSFMTLGLFIATAIAVGLTNKPALANCNFLSYWQTSDGTCFNLTAFTQLGAIQSELSKPPVYGNKNIDVTNLRLIRTSIGADVRGTVTNISKQPIRVGMIDYELVNSNGVPIHDGTFVVTKTLQPSQTISISTFITPSDLQRYSASSLSVLKVW